jgi:hypothetical protein
VDQRQPPEIRFLDDHAGNAKIVRRDRHAPAVVKRLVEAERPGEGEPAGELPSGAEVKPGTGSSPAMSDPATPAERASMGLAPVLAWAPVFGSKHTLRGGFLDDNLQ